MKICWCKWFESGLIGDLFIIFFRIIENRVSKLGYQSIKIIKKGEILWFHEKILIKNIENRKPNKYEPESPR